MAHCYYKAMLKRLRPFLAIAVLLATVVVTVYFFRENPKIIDELKSTSPVTLGLVLALYLGFMVALGLVTKASINLCKGNLPRGEMVLLTAYSSIINFFGPLQSGPAFRAVYLKKRHGISLKNYTLASLLNYFFYAFFSGLLLISGVLGWWSVLFGGLLLIIGYVALRVQFGPLKRMKEFQNNAIGFMAVAVFLQVTMLTLIFLAELRSVDSSVTIGQALVYTGAANFALFVSITPGAIGFRESFVFFTQQLHNIDTPTIVAASLIDRGVYVFMLVGLAAIIFITKSSKQLTRYRN